MKDRLTVIQYRRKVRTALSDARTKYNDACWAVLILSDDPDAPIHKLNQAHVRMSHQGRRVRRLEMVMASI